jgi:hypothetical protein
LEARAPTRQIVATRNHRYIILSASARGKGIQVILDSSIQGNFISPETIKQLNMLIREKKKPYPLSIIDRTIIKQNKGIVRYKTIFIQVIIRRHIEEISLDIVKIGSYQVIFGIP